MLIRAARTSSVVYIAIIKRIPSATRSEESDRGVPPFFFCADPQLSAHVPQTPDYGSPIWRRWKWSGGSAAAPHQNSKKKNEIFTIYTGRAGSVLRRPTCSGSGDSVRTRSSSGSTCIGDFEIFIKIAAEGLIPHCTHTLAA